MANWNHYFVGLIIAAWVVIEFLIGGTRLVFSLPSYALLSVAGILSALAFRQPQAPPNARCLLATGLFFGYVLARILFSPVAYLARPDLFMVLAALVIYFVVAFYLTARKFRLWLVAALLVLGLVHVVIGTFQIARGETFLVFSFLQPANYGRRATGLYICPNHMAGFLEIATVMGLSLACWSRWKLWLKLIVGYGALVCLGGIIITGSRGGYLSTMAGLSVFAVFSLIAILKGMPGRSWQVTLGAVILAAHVGAGIFYLISQERTLEARAGRLFDEKDARIELWQAAIQQFKTSPVVGTGSGTYLYYGRQHRAPHIIADPVYAHNDYLQLLAEFGVIGAAAFLFFLVSHLWAGGRSFKWFVSERQAELGRIRSDSMALNIGAMSAVAAYMVHSIFDFNLHIPANTLVMAFVFGVLANPGVERPNEVKEFGPLPRAFQFALPALALWLLVASVLKLPGEFFGERARVALRDEKFAESVAFAEKAIAWEKKNPYLYFYLGEAQSMLAEAGGNRALGGALLTAAGESFQKGLELFPQDRYLLLGMGWILDTLARFSAAEAFYLKALEWEPNSAHVRMLYAGHLQRAGRYAAAAEQYRKSLDLQWTVTANAGLQRLVKEGKVRK